MKKLKKSFVAFLLCGCMLCGLAACNKDKPEEPKEITHIKYGTHWKNGLDPHVVDEATGKYVMDENQRQARLAAEEAILKEYGVVFDYIEYPSNTTEALLQSVLAGDPICDIAILWGGSEKVILQQNVCQQLDQYMDIFKGNPDYEWLVYDKMFGHNYLLTDVIRYIPRWPLCYNITMIEQVDSLKDEKGNTIYPNTLFDEGKWTWSTFKDYLEKVNAYYASDDNIDAYYTDYRAAMRAAVFANGGAIYDNGVVAANKENKEAVAYVKELCDAGLMVASHPAGNWDGCWDDCCNKLGEGKTVFAEMADWRMKDISGQLAERNESMGIVPWPRPDDVALDSEEYKQVITVGDSHCILKGVSPERTELALKAWALYEKVYNCEFAGADSIADIKKNSSQQALNFGLDIAHEKIGDSVLNSFLYIGSHLKQDFSDLLGVLGTWEKVVKDAYSGDTASYDVAIDAALPTFTDAMKKIETSLASDKFFDTVEPSVSKKQDYAIVPVGTKITDDIWMQFISATDNVDGELGMAQFEPEFNKDENNVEYTEDIFETPGFYNRAFKAYFHDKNNNKGYCTISVFVYNPDNTAEPTLIVAPAGVVVAKDTDVNAIKWNEIGAVEMATDADGIDLSEFVKADNSVLDTTTAGSYLVPLTVTDFVGNTATAEITVIVQ